MSRVCIAGFDYAADPRGPVPVSHTLEEWKSLISNALKAGCRRRVKDGDTFIHNAAGVMVLEAWANVPAPKT